MTQNTHIPLLFDINPCFSCSIFFSFGFLMNQMVYITHTFLNWKSLMLEFEWSIWFIRILIHILIL